LKLDGARAQLRVIGRAPTLRTRRGRRCDNEFPEILAAAAGLPDVILDGGRGRARVCARLLGETVRQLRTAGAGQRAHVVGVVVLRLAGDEDLRTGGRVLAR
jgi:hypothetical protein